MKETLAIRAVTVFKDLFPEHWKHALVEGTDTANICYKCNTYFDIGDELANGLCTKPGKPIDINDWNVAMKLYRSLDACQRTNAHSELVQIFLQEIDDDRGTVDQFVAANDPTELMLSTDTWFWNFGEPKHLILAACKAKEAENEIGR